VVRWWRVRFDPGDELALLAETARKLAQEELRPRLREAESAHAVADSVRAAFAAVGLAASSCRPHTMAPGSARSRA